MSAEANDSNSHTLGKHGICDRWWVLPGRLWRAIAPPISVAKNIDGIKFHLSLRDNIHYIVSSARTADEAKRLLQEPFTSFWDVGANIGIFSLLAAKRGKQVVAFDMSSQATALIRRSATANGLSLEIENRAFTVERTHYKQVYSAHTENRMVACAKNESGQESITYLDAARKYGIPDMIKMDIEGGELEFLKSPAFKEWIMENRITFAVEIHSKEIMEYAWHDVGFQQMDPGHIIFNSKA